MSKTEATDEVLTAAEVAQMLRCSRQLAYRLFDDGEIKGFKAGSHRRYYKSSVQQYMNGGQRNVIPINQDEPVDTGTGFDVLREFGYDASSQGPKTC